jgi:DNA polymerase (family X)
LTIQTYHIKVKGKALTLTNREIAEIFETIADMLQLKGENLHRYLSYRRAGETIRELPRGLRAIAAEGALTDLPNIGKTLADKINEMLETDQLEFYERLKAEIPLGVVAIMNINGVGPKKAKLFWDELDITSIDALQLIRLCGLLERVCSGMSWTSPA